MRELAVLFLVFAGCDCQPPLTGATGKLRITESRLEFGDTWLRTTTTRQLHVQNEGRAPLEVSLTTGAPFDLDQAVTLSGGEARVLDARFTPDQLGAVESTLTVNAGGTSRLVTLAGAGVEPPACDSTLCRNATLDPTTARCVLTPVADGTGCTNACLTEAHCEGASCVGAQRSCDDGDPCTIDACDPGSGCTHTPKTCRASGACLEARCDPQLGCVEDPATDGTSCGARDCTSALVCIQGQCVSRAVPDGAPCGATSVCQLPGQCVSSACVQPPATPLKRLWQYVPSVPGRQLVGLVGERGGTLYTVECRYAGMFRSQCELLALAADGTERFRTPFTHITNTGSGALRGGLMLAGEYLISSIEPSWLQAFSRSTGQLVWSVDLRTLGLVAAPVDTVWVRTLAFDGRNTVITALEGSHFGSFRSSLVAGFDVATGAVVQQFPLPAQSISLVLDTNAHLFVAHGSGGVPWSDTITSLDTNWGVRWQRLDGVLDSRVRELMATHAGQLVWQHPSDAKFVSTTAGGTGASLPGGFANTAVWNDDALFLLRQFCPTATCAGFFDYRFEFSIVPQDGSSGRRGALPTLSWYASPWVTDRPSVLIGLRERQPPEAVLLEVVASGATTMRCSLQLSTRRNPRAAPILMPGRYTMLNGEDSDGYNPVIDVWELPGYAPASSGWISPKGGPEQDFRGR